MATMTDRSSSTSMILRKRYGAWLKDLRQDAGLTQMDVAAQLGYDYYTMISQIERGLGRIPVQDLQQWAELYRQDPKHFAKKALYWTDPYVYAALYGYNPIDEQKLPHPPRDQEKRTVGASGRRSSR